MDITVGATPFPQCRTNVRCNPSFSEAVPELAGLFTLSLTTGAANMQTYLTRDEILTLANGLIALAQLSEVTA